MQYRIRRYDAHNWTIERLTPSRPIPTGPKKGQPSEPKWAIVGYHGTLLSAAQRLLDYEIAERWPEDGSAVDPSDVAARISDAESSVSRTVRSLATEAAL